MTKMTLTIALLLCLWFANPVGAQRMQIPDDPFAESEKQQAQFLQGYPAFCLKGVKKAHFLGITADMSVMGQANAALSNQFAADLESVGLQIDRGIKPDLSLPELELSASFAEKDDSGLGHYHVKLRYTDTVIVARNHIQTTAPIWEFDSDEVTVAYNRSARAAMQACLARVTTYFKNSYVIANKSNQP